MFPLSVPLLPFPFLLWKKNLMFHLPRKSKKKKYLINFVRHKKEENQKK
jgi:hypothetical protein